MRLRLPTPGLVGSPHVHSSCLGPVSFAGLLIKCLHFIGLSWAFAQLRPHVALRGLCSSAVWAASPLGWCPPYGVRRAISNYFFQFFMRPQPTRCVPPATRLWHPRICHLFLFIFIPLLSFLVSAPRCWWRSGILSHLFIFYSLALFGLFSV